MARRRRGSGLLAWDLWTLGFEAASVVGLRSVSLAMGGAAAQREARRMVSEKVAAALELQRLALTGGLGLTGRSAAGKTVAHYRRKVRANRRRLAKV